MLPLGLGEQELELPHLVAGEIASGLVVPLDEKLRPIRAPAIETLHARRQIGQLEARRKP